MNVTNEDISFWGSAMVIVGVVFSFIKGFVIMKEKVRALDKKVDTNKEETDKRFEHLEAIHTKDIDELKKLFNEARKETQQAQKEVIDLINKNHISVLEKMNELIR